MVFKCRIGHRATLKLLLFSVVSVCLFVLSLNLNKERSIINLGPAFTIIQGNGKIHIDDLNGFEEVSDEQKIYLMDKLRNSIHALIKFCSGTKPQPRSCGVPPSGKLLTLFTTWSYDEAKFSVNNKTLYNWKMLPYVNLVVFADVQDFKVKQLNKQAGWDILPITNEAAGTPILPKMFLDVMKKYKSKFYGFANADILFTKKLIDTLLQVVCHSEAGYIDNDKGLLIVGRRTNVPADKLTHESALSWQKLEQFSNRYGELFQSDAEDYFITDSNYPWSSFLPVTVGRRGFDNWIVAYSRYINITVIDASESIQCIHQTLKSRGNFESLSKGRYNIELIEQQNMPFDFGWGRTYCTRWKSWYDLCGRLMISERRSVPISCTEYKFSYKLAAFFGLN